MRFEVECIEIAEGIMLDLEDIALRLPFRFLFLLRCLSCFRIGFWVDYDERVGRGTSAEVLEKAVKRARPKALYVLETT